MCPPDQVTSDLSSLTATPTPPPPINNEHNLIKLCIQYGNYIEE